MRKQITYVLVTVLFVFGSLFSSQANFLAYDNGPKVVVVVLDKMGNETSLDFVVPSAFIGENGKLLTTATITLTSGSQKTSYTLETSNCFNIITDIQLNPKSTSAILEIEGYRVSN